MPRNNGHKLHPRNRTHGLLSLSESQGTGRMSLWCSPKDMRSPWKKARSTRVPGTAAGHAFRCCRCCGFDHGLRHLRRWRSQTATGDKPPRSTRMISRATSPPRPCGCVCLVPGPPTERLRPGVRGWRAARYEAPEIHAAAPVGEVIPTAPHPPAAPDREDREGSPTRTRQGTARS